MKKLLVLTAILIGLGAVSAVYAEQAPAVSSTQAADAGNKLCPVSGNPVSGTDFVVYDGKRYGLCCPMCEKPFLLDPVKYIAKVNEELKADEAAAEFVNAR